MKALGLPGIAAAIILILIAGPSASAAERQVPPNAASVQLSFAPIVKRVAPAVVNVYATRTVQEQVSPFFSDPFFRQFFGNQFGGRPSQRVLQSLGSGVIIRSDGLIVTNYHVIAGADEVKVALSDKRELAADIVLKDQRSDLAVLRISGNVGNLPTIAFADSDQVEVGDLVLAIGDPFGVGQTVTSGIVSALDRAPDDTSGDQYFIQTDAAINRGNSGGALVDMDGRLIGINSMIVSPSGGSIGLGFAIPSNLVSTVVSGVGNGSAPRRPWFGAEMQSLTPDLAASLSIDKPSGVLIASLVPGGPAEAAGLKVDDLIVSIDGTPVDDLSALKYRLATRQLGSTVTIGIVRNRQPQSVSLTLQAAPETPPRDPKVIDGSSALAGLTVVNLSPAVADEFSYTGDLDGVMVSDVADGSNAADAGFQPGDVIARINGAKIKSTGQLADTVSQHARYYDLIVKRAGRSFPLRMPG